MAKSKEDQIKRTWIRIGQSANMFKSQAANISPRPDHYPLERETRQWEMHNE